MKKIINKTSTPIYDFLALLSIVFSQIIVIILFYICMAGFFYGVKETLLDKIFNYLLFLILIIFLYILNKRLIVALKYFFALEECFCENGIFYYKKTLFKKIKIKELSISVTEILNIYDLGKRIIEAEKSTFVHYFKPNERIGIKTIYRKEYKIWNYVRRANLLHIDNRYDKDRDFFVSFKEIKEMIEEEKKKILFFKKVEKLNSHYNSSLNERYNYILNKIAEEEKLYLFEKEGNYIINGDSEAVKYLNIFKNMKFEEIDFYIFCVNYFSKKEYEDKKVIVGYNGIDGKEVFFRELKEDINKIRDSR